MEYLKDQKYYQVHQYFYDYIFDEKAKQEDVYNIASSDSIRSILNGYNSTIIAYGQTGTGKTYTMEGDYENKGIIQRAIEDMFSRVNLEEDTDVKYTFKASFLQIYNEQIFDLLNISNKNLNLREDKAKGIFVENLSEYEINNYEDAIDIIDKGNNNRNTAKTKMNIKSSRSHAIFILHVEKTKKGFYKSYSKLNLVDLAGSERLRITNAKGKRLEECKKINQSLAELANVINALCNKNNKSRTHIPYRNTKLTRLLEDSLGGNCKTTILATVSPHADAFNETISTLKFAKRAKKININPVSNKKIDINPNNWLKKYENDIKVLQKNKILQEKSINKENESNNFEESIHIEKYKSLLVKQREILISLTERWNQRDEIIKKLKQEVDTITEEKNLLKDKISKENTLKDCSNNLFNNISIKNEKNNEFLESFDKEILSINKKSNDDKNSKILIDKVKTSVDSIILSLSKQNESLDLHKIAKNLLKVQKNINKLSENYN